MLDVLFPYSYMSVSILVFLGYLFAISMVGFTVGFIILVFIYAGLIRITPLLRFLSSFLSETMPNTNAKIRENIKESFKSRFTEPIPDGKYIYAWHPHGVISMSQCFHIGTPYTDWPRAKLRPIKGAMFYPIQWLPFGQEMLDYTGAIPSDYYAMKNALLNNTSVSISVGGIREMLGDSYIVKKRRGIFKMALETGTPIVPVLSFGENKLFSLVEIDPSIQNFLEQYDICVCIPTFHSFVKWVKLLYNPLKDSITSVVGKPIPVEKIETPTEADIAALRETYIAALRDLFTKENPNKDEVFSVI